MHGEKTESDTTCMIRRGEMATRERTFVQYFSEFRWWGKKEIFDLAWLLHRAYELNV